jgi:lytic murein transglycosylase
VSGNSIILASARDGLRILAAALVALLLVALPVAAADAQFQRWLDGVWPEAEAAGVSRAVFDAATRDLTPDLSLPDLHVPGRKEQPPGQAEFVLTPGQYLKEATISRLAAQGRKLAADHRDTLAHIERDFHVPGEIVLAIWGRETDYGRYKLPYDAIRVLATQGYTGRRHDLFRGEFIKALRMLQDGVPRSAMRSSWGGAMGLTQFLPSDYFRYAVDYDGDGTKNIWTSVPDALAAAARQLVAKGWRSGLPWAIEVRVPDDADCTEAEPSVKRPLAEWLNRGFVPAYGRKIEGALLAAPASLLMPEGSYGPAFLTTENYFVIKEYNYSDLYVLFVGHLSERIAGGKPFETPWEKEAQLRTRDVETMQQRLAALGLYKDKIDGKAGMLTRSAVGAYQKENGLKVDCWPTAAVLERMR